MTTRCQTYEGRYGEGVLDDPEDSGSGCTVYCDCEAGKELQAIERPAREISWRCLDCFAEGVQSEGGIEHEQWTAHEVRHFISSPSPGGSVSQLDMAPSGSPGVEQPGEGRVLEDAEMWRALGPARYEVVERGVDYGHRSIAERSEDRADKMVRDRGGRIPGIDR